MRLVQALNTLLSPLDARLVRASRHPSPGDPGRAGDEGECPCCARPTRFVEHGSWLRDQYLCERCHSVPRQRALVHALDTFFPAWPTLTVHESSPSADFLRQRCRDYSSSFFFPDVAPGAADLKGRRCENLEQLTFPSSSLDLFVTQDVLEHVFNPDAAAREILRVLKPGGAHVFTAPKHRHLPASVRRARLEGGAVVHLEPPAYHGNPIDPEGSLVTWDYGDDFESLLWRWCGAPTTTLVTRDRRLGLDGEHLEVFVTRKLA